MRGEPGLATIDALVATIGRHPMLLVRDGVEQLAAAGPDLVEIVQPRLAGTAASPSGPAADG